MPNPRLLHGVLTTCALLASTSVYAEDQEPTLTPSPEENQECPSPDATCPSPDQDQNQNQGETMTPEATPEPQPATPPPQTTYVEPAPMAEPTSTTMVGQESYTPWYDRYGIGLSVGGGVDDFVSDSFRNTTSTGGSWNVRATFGTRSYIAGEASYIGSAQSIDALGLDSDAVLVGNGLQGAVRINVLPNFAVQPFLYGGAAWRHYELSDTNFNTSDVQDSDDVFEVPVGVGVAGYIAGFMADVRAEYRGAWDSDLIPRLQGDDDNAIVGEADRWGVSGSIGMSF